MAQIRFDVTIREEDGMLWAEVEQLPGCFTSGENIEELEEALFEALQMCLPPGVTLVNPELRPPEVDEQTRDLATADDAGPRRMVVCA